MPRIGQLGIGQTVISHRFCLLSILHISPVIPVQAGETEEERAAARQRQAQRAEQVRRDMEANSVRLEPLGQDRRYNRYWRFVLATATGGAGHAGGGEGEPAQQGQQAAAEDACSGRLFFESHDDGSLRWELNLFFLN